MSLPIAESSQVDPGASAPGLPPVQSEGPELPNGTPSNGSFAPTSTESAGTPTANRTGAAGREVAFVEPEKQRPESTAAQQWQNAEGGRRDQGSDAMDVDETPGRSDEQSRLSALRKPPPLDASRPLDVLSSPSSTTQTATTPAVQDASPDTSPDHEGPPYPGDDDDSVCKKEDEDHRDFPGSGQAPDRDQVGGQADMVAVQPAPQPAPEPAPATTPTPTPAPTGDVEAATSGDGLESSTPIMENGNTTQPAAPAGSAPPSGPLSDSSATVAAAGSAETPITQPPSTSQATAQLAQDETHHKTRRPSPLQIATSQDISGPAGVVNQEPGASFSGSVSTHLTNGTGFDQRTQTTQVSPADPVPNSQIEETVEHEHDYPPTSSVLRARSLAEKHGYKHRRTPTVVFEKSKEKPGETIVASRSQSRPDRIPTDDYFVPLFFDGFTRQSQWMRSPEQLLVTSHKTISTPDWGIALHENQACKVLRRIYHLQQNDKWSLRQPKRCPEPTRPPSHWDLLLQEMKWMRTDFREERKWKRAVARNLAEACAEWVASSEEDRKILQVNARIPPIEGEHSSSKSGTTPPEEESLTTPMPDLVPSGDADSPMDIDDEPREWHAQTVAPSAIFALQDDEVVFGLQQTSASDQLLEELPLYGAPLKSPQFDVAGPAYDPDGQWRRPALPLSKYVEGEMTLKSAGPRPKRSRYQYAVEDEEDDDEVVFGNDQAQKSDLAPENTDVALFRPEMKLVRDRLHAGHQFRPPTESLMPLQSFFESRIASQWTPAEDEELRKQVREYSYNWSLISKNISSKSLFISGEERRTPWECFERWVQLEGYPNDVARTQYFQTYQRRIDQAQRAIALANHNASQQAAPNGAVVPRRRPTLPLRVERRTSRRHLALIDAMKKLAKKREAAAAKQQQSTNTQSRRTSTEAPQQKLNIKTPEDYARARYERDKQMTEKIARTLAAQQQEAQRRVSARPGVFTLATMH
jgi:chromatin modification-related protein VID21